jgi:hypothetical protein
MNDTDSMEVYILEAKELSGRDDVTLELLFGMRAEIEEIVGKNDEESKFKGFFTWVNVVWVLSVLVMVCTCGPCTAKLIGPYLARLAASCGKVGKKVLLFTVEQVIIPFVTFLHNWGIIEAFLYIVSFQLIFEGSLFQSRLTLGFMLSLFGVLLMPGLWLYST